MNLPALPLGARVRHHRNRRRRSQAAIAGLCGITEDYLSQIERGRKIPSPEVLAKIAAELSVPISHLLGDESSAQEEETVPPVASDAVVRALLNRSTTPGPDRLDPAALRDAVESLWRTWQESPTRFTEVEAVLPNMIGDVEDQVRAHRHGSDAAARREVLRIAGDLYGLLRSYCRRAGRLDLSLMVADRALRAAEDADDPLRIAAANWNLGHVLLSQPGDETSAQDVALRAAHTLAQTLRTPEAVAVRGALELVAVVAEARTRKAWDARSRLEERVLPLAEQAGEGNVLWTVFGPTNMILHAVSVEMHAGDTVEALRVADRVDITQLPSRERQFTFTLEVARCYDLRREDASVLVHLLELEELAPEDLQRSPLARELVISLVSRARPTYRRQATGLAERLHLL